MPRLPSQLTYNDLNGQEAVDILCDWFRQLLMSQTWAQRHITLPMAKVSLDVAVQVDMYIGGSVPIESPPETLTVAGSVSLDNHLSAQTGQQSSMPVRTESRLSTVINAAPIPGGVPPDQVREQH